MADQIENLYDAFPHRATLKRLFHRDAGHVRRFDTMKASNHVAQFVDMAHAAVLTKSATVQ